MIKIRTHNFWSDVPYVFLMGLILSMLISGCSDDSPKPIENLYEVNAPSQLIVRSEPSKFGQKIVSLPDKAVIKVDNVENGWAHVVAEDYEGYVNAEYINFVSSVSLNDEDEDGVSKYEGGKNIKQIGDQTLPYIILVLAIVAMVVKWKDEDRLIPWILLLMSISEFAYMMCQWLMGDFWFLDADEVGWVMVVINYIVTFAILVFQGILVWGEVSESSSGWFNGILNFLLSALVGFSVFGLVRAFDKINWFVGGILGLFVVALVCVLYYSQRNWINIIKMGIINLIVIPVYLALLVNMINLIIVVLISVVGIQLFSIRSSRGSSQNKEGVLKKAIIYEDGKRYELTQVYTTAPDYYVDQYGGRWEETLSGFRRL